MRRTVLLLVLALAATIAVEPVVHVHPLAPEQSGGDSYSPVTLLRCTLCATAAARVLFDVPEIVAPAVIAYALPIAAPQAAPAPTFAPLPSRAPPVA